MISFEIYTLPLVWKNLINMGSDIQNQLSFLITWLPTIELQWLIVPLWKGPPPPLLTFLMVKGAAGVLWCPILFSSGCIFVWLAVWIFWNSVTTLHYSYVLLCTGGLFQLKIVSWPIVGLWNIFQFLLRIKPNST